MKNAAQVTLERAKRVDEEHKVVERAKIGASNAWERIREVPVLSGCPVGVSISKEPWVIYNAKLQRRLGFWVHFLRLTSSATVYFGLFEA